MKNEAFKIDEKLIKLLRQRKEKTGQSIKWQIEEAVRQFLKRHKWNRSA